jgi:hypothetical protein
MTWRWIKYSCGTAKNKVLVATNFKGIRRNSRDPKKLPVRDVHGPNWHTR